MSGVLWKGRPAAHGWVRWLLLAALLQAVYGFITYPQVFFVLDGVRQKLLALNNGTTEQFACLSGVRIGSTAFVLGVTPAPAARQRGNAWATEVICSPSLFLLGLAHSHPLGINCWYRFPGTDTPTSDLVSFRESGQALGMIVCGETLAWVQR